jgi:excinuclease ABC subunit A
VYVINRFHFLGKRDVKEELSILMQKGFSRIYDAHAKGLSRIEEIMEWKNWKPSQDTFVLIDRLVVREFDEDDRHRISDSINTAFYEGEGEVYLMVNEDRMLQFSNRFELDGIKFEEPVPNLFSF